MSPHRALRLAPALLLAACIGPLQAAVIDDPASGGESFFAWEDIGGLTGVFDVGPDDGVSDEPGGGAGWFLSLPSLHRIGITAYNASVCRGHVFAHLSTANNLIGLFQQ